MAKDNLQDYKLSDTDVSLLHYVQRHQQAVFSGLLSNIAMRLGYTVTENTQFALTPDLSGMKITELAPEPDSSNAVKQAE